MNQSKPFISSTMSVENDWIDYNGHMNMAYYNVLFDRCMDQFLDSLGIGAAYAKTRQLTIYTAEVHVCYQQELHIDHEVNVSLHMIDHDAKRLHLYQEIIHSDGWIAATSESMSLHIDMTGPKVSPFPADIYETIKTIQSEHASFELPQNIGRSIAIQHK